MKNKKTSFTPGPWFLIKNPMHPRLELKAPSRAYYIGSINLPDGGADIDGQEANANAALIAAAPEMFEALENSLYSMAKHFDYHDPIAKQVMIDCRAALAKAKGEN